MKSWIVREEEFPRGDRGLRINICEICDEMFDSIADEPYEKCVTCMMKEVEEENDK